MSIPKRILADLEGFQEHFLAFGRVVGFELLKSKAVIGGDGQRMVGP